MRSRLTGRIVCVKRSRKHLFATMSEDPVEEARILKLLGMENVKGVVEYIDSSNADPDYFWLVMEACEADLYTCIVK